MLHIATSMSFHNSAPLSLTITRGVGKGKNKCVRGACGTFLAAMSMIYLEKRTKQTTKYREPYWFSVSCKRLIETKSQEAAGNGYCRRTGIFICPFNLPFMMFADSTLGYVFLYFHAQCGSVIMLHDRNQFLNLKVKNEQMRFFIT